MSYDVDLKEIEAILAEELPKMTDAIPGLAKPPQYEGVDALGDSGVNLCIAIPFNQPVLHNGDDTPKQ